MSEYIDFEVARKYLHKACECIGGNGGMMLKIKFDEEPTADVREVKRGEWIKDENGYFHCPFCDFKFYPLIFKYCPNCGADMRGEHNEQIH